MSVRQYIGARYVTKIYENSLDPSSAEWEGGRSYEPLTLVTYLNSSYLSKKDVPASVGDPASNPTYWVITGAYNGQITSLQAQIDQISNTLYIVGPDAKYQTITAAYNACVANGGGTILITEGTYDEAITGGNVTVPVTFLGTDRNKCIWKSSTFGYANACFTGTGDITFENLTMYKSIPAGETTLGGYALHMDYPGATGQMLVNNCNLISEENAAIGCGTGTDQKITIDNCYIEFYNKNTITNNNGALLYHTSATAGATGQSFKLRNCLIKSSGALANILNSAGNTEPVPIEVINNYFYSTSATYSPDSANFELSSGYSDPNNLFSYTTGQMCGNNINKFNANKYSGTFNNAVKTNTGKGVEMAGDMLDWDYFNGFILIPLNSVEQPAGAGINHAYYGFVFGYDKDNKAAIVTDFSSGSTYYKRIRNGAVQRNWSLIDFGLLVP